MSSPIKVVLVGCGGMANAWIDAASKTPAVQIVGMVDLFRPSAEKLAEKWKFPPSIVFNSLKEALEATKAEAVFDVTVPVAHDKVVIEALESGCYVLGEKPMSDTLEKAQKMVATANRTGKLYQVIQNYRYNSNIARFSHICRSGAIGQVEEIHADFFIGAHFGGFRDEMDYPLILDMSIHTFDAARYITGADPVAVYAHSFNPARSWYKGDASAVVIFEMVTAKGDKIVFNYRGSWCADGLHTPWNSQWRVVASQGAATWDGETGIKAVAKNPAGKPGFFLELVDVPVPTEITVENGGHVGLMHDFVNAIRNNVTPQTICTDNIKSLAMVLASVESAKKGEKVKVVW